MNFKKKSQAEIFGLAIFLVILIIGFLIYSKFSNDINEDDNELKNQYNLLAASTNNILLKKKIICEELGEQHQTILDLTIYCSQYSSLNGEDTGDDCNCELLKDELNETLKQLFINNSIFGNIPYEFEFSLTNENYDESLLNFKISNSNETILKRKGWNRVSGEPGTISTSQGDLIYEVFLWYK